METRGMKRARLSGRTTNNNTQAQEDDTLGPNVKVFKMETRSMKRARLSRASADNRRSEEGRDGMEEGEAPNPSAGLFGELLEQVFLYLSPQELKVIRQVSKNWNVEACRALRKRSSVFFYDRKIESLDNMDLAAVMESGRQLGLPTPFQEFRGMLVHRSSFRLLGNLLTRNKKFRVRITSLHFMAIRLLNSDARSLHRSLMKCAPQLRVLDFFTDPYHFRFPNIRIMEHLSFPLLQSFGFIINDTSNQNSVDFLVGVINGSPKLNDLTVKYLHYEDKMLAEIYTRSNLKTIQELTLVNFFPFSFPQLLKDLMLVEIDSLKTLRLANVIGLGDESTLQLMRIVSKFSPSLQHLSWTFNMCPVALWAQFPECPMLTELKVGDILFGKRFWSGLPALKKFESRTVYFDLESNLDLDEDERRVKHASLEEFLCKRFGDVVPEDGDKILHEAFPNMTSLVRKSA